MAEYHEVTRGAFWAHYGDARVASDRIREATSEPEHTPDARYYLSTFCRSGYVIRAGGDLTNVFSLDRGQGDALMRSAIANGAETLDCFDGYLPTFYARHGFVEYAREANWTPGGPDVVFMALRSRVHTTEGA